MKRITAASLIALGALTLTACSDTHQMLSTGPDSITVSGNGEIAAQPDIFRVAATAREQGDDIAAMKSRVDDAVAVGDVAGVEPAVRAVFIHQIGNDIFLDLESDKHLASLHVFLRPQV